jgi:stage II sporulation protein E
VGTHPSYIKRSKHLEVVRTSSLPAGVFNEIEVPLVERSFRSDTLVLASDGVVDACQSSGGGESWIEKFLEDARYPSAQDLADALVKEAVKLSEGNIMDDGIVLVIRQKKQTDK